MSTPHQYAIQKCKEVVAKAKELYGIDLAHVPVTFNRKGRALGVAGCSMDRFTRVTSGHFIKLNGDGLFTSAYEHLINETIPHEYAHTICQMRPEMGYKHDAGWKAICIALGGSGKTTHQEEVVRGTGTTYEYTSSNGNKLRVGDKHHNRIQRGETIKFLRNKGSLMKGCAYSIVGVRGRPLATPIVKNATHAPQLVSSPAVQPFAAPTFFLGASTVKPVESDVWPFNHASRAPKTVAPAAVKVKTVDTGGNSKASIARELMRTMHAAGASYEAIIAAIMDKTGHPRQLARATYKANAAKVGVPVQ